MRLSTDDGLLKSLRSRAADNVGEDAVQAAELKKILLHETASQICEKVAWRYLAAAR